MGAKGGVWAPMLSAKPCGVTSACGDEGLTVGYSCSGMPCIREGYAAGEVDCEASGGDAGVGFGACFGWGGCACLTTLFSVAVTRFARFDLVFFFRGPRREGRSAGGLSCLPAWAARPAKITEKNC